MQNLSSDLDEQCKQTARDQLFSAFGSRALAAAKNLAFAPAGCLLTRPDKQRRYMETSSWASMLFEDPTWLQRGRKPNRDFEVDFVLRTFYYLGYIALADLPLHADGIRATILRGVERAQASTHIGPLSGHAHSFSEELSASLSAAWSRRLARYPRLLALAPSPLAALVFVRAAGRRERLVPEIERLRVEMKGMRSRLEILGDKADWDRVDDQQIRIMSYRRPGRLMRSGDAEKGFAKATEQYLYALVDASWDVATSPVPIDRGTLQDLI